MGYKYRQTCLTRAAHRRFEKVDDVHAFRDLQMAVGHLDPAACPAEVHMYPRHFGVTFRERAEPLRALAGGGITAALPQLVGVTGQVLSVAGPLAAFLGPIVGQLQSYLDQRLRAELDARDAAFAAEIRELRQTTTQRQQNDPKFAAELARRAFAETLAEEALLGKRVEPSARLSFDDLGF